MSGEPARILVVDDEPGIRDLLRLNLRHAGYAVTAAASAEEADAALAGATFELVLSDICMPDVSGLELLARLKRRDPEMPVVLMTAYSTTELAIEALNRGAFAFLSKPFKMDELHGTLRNAREKYRVVRRNRELLHELEHTNASLQQVGLMLRSINDLEQLLVLLLEQMLIISGGEVGAIILKEGSGYSVRATFGIAAHHLDLYRMADNRSLLDHLVAGGTPGLVMRTADGQHCFQPINPDPAAAAALPAQPVSRNPQVRVEVSNTVYIPFNTAERTIGLALICNTREPGCAAPAFLADLVSITSYAALALERSQLFAVAIEKEKLDHEVRLAHEVQRKLLPAAVPQLPGCRFFAVCRPARIVGGDYYDFIAAPGRMNMLITDVQGKGIPAALVMAQVSSAIRSWSEYLPDPAALTARLNRMFCETLPDMLQPFLIAGYDPSARRLTLVNAGHCLPLLRAAATDAVRELGPNEMILGLNPGTGYHVQEHQLAPGDCLLLYTDGVTDLLDAPGREFGKARLAELLARQAGGGDVTATGQALLAALAEHGRGTEQFDDITFILMQVQ